MELKIENVGEKLLLGPTHIELLDQTEHTYNSKDFRDFVNYLTPEKNVVFVDGNKLEAYPVDAISKPYYNMQPLAKCELKFHPILALLIAKNNTAFDLVDFGDFLQTVKDNIMLDSLSLLDICKNLKITKIVSIDREGDKRGNFVYSVRAEKGKQDYEFPETVKFACPIFEDGSGLIKTEFNLNFNWEIDSAGAVGLEFKLVNLLLPIQIREETYTLFTQTFEKAGIKKFFGSLVVKPQTNKNLIEVTKVGNIQ